MKITNLDKGWKFNYSSGNSYLDEKGAAYSEMVDLPHDFMIRTKRTADSLSQGAGGYFQGGIGTYSRTLSFDETQKESSVMLQIDGSYGNTEVWINGSMAALHHYGYTEFIVDLTEYINFGGENKLKIVVENTHLPNSRWYSGCGLYRHVWLLEAQEVYLDPWSVFVTTPTTDQICVEINITNTSSAVEGNVQVCVLDMADRQVITMEDTVEISQGRQKVNLSANVEGLRLWTLEEPELYRAIVTVEAGANKDQKEVTFGVRTIAFTREQGFLLNGKPVKLKGGCIHHDNGIVGSCAFSAMEERKIRLLKESGYNAIRTSHNPMSTALLDACDKCSCAIK